MAGVKGRSGKPKDKLFADMIRMAVNETTPDGVRKIRKIAERVTDLAVAGESWACQMIADRLDGKPAQEATVTVYSEFTQLTDDQIAARIAELRGAGASNGDCASTVDPSQLN